MCRISAPTAPLAAADSSATGAVTAANACELSETNRPLRAGPDFAFRASAQKGRFVLSEFCHPQAGSHRFLFQEMA